MSWRLGIYRAVTKDLVGRYLGPWWFRGLGRFGVEASAIHSVAFRPRSPGVRRLWFHAASVGELETLWSVAQTAAKAGAVELVLTVFSESALKAVERLASELSRVEGCRVEFAGYSPWEGGWGACLRKAAPDVFVTAKYEAWPELWAELEMSSTPLVIVGALSRRSLRIAKSICAWLGKKPPRMTLLAASEADVPALAALFPGVRLEHTGDPRWDRVRARSRAGNPRVATLLASCAASPKPWGVMGSAWLADLEVWGDSVRETRAAGTLWVVPHRVDEESLTPIERWLKARGLRPRRSSREVEPSPPSEGVPVCVLVDEMGFLSELYAAADWAYVGGGFGDGVHSTIEPALQGIAVASGSARSDRFPEIADLQATGQLELVSSALDVALWLSKLGEGPSRKSEWLAQAEARLGATERVWQRISEAIRA